ncbi:UDP-N-acetylglucosamine 3-dehydrogenase [Halogranum amylolyticum]|uniref:UDP-N-acetylglucosamine 3-dehydrogenase n=1 Tax=Halogranum amylolyticum TaxID=660520 RepID=A0A1H8WNN2_9EURY|nr:Gfo/Idh/MocA family oxidoreductase [Halogranum amylolyticum]SEP29047.1 UDP-N-acetylglucosamine 3-dehydrogenase [Halogranum amylolyticum]
MTSSEPTNDGLTYAVIGTGYWGSNHARVAAELLDDGIVDDVVFCDVDEGRVADMAADYGVAYTTDHTELPELGVDAATVATPSPTHHTIATDLLEAGVDLLVEKPLARTSEDAWDIVDVADTNDRVLAVGHIFRYHPALSDLKRRIDRGELGRIKYLTTNRYAFRVPREEAGVLFSLAVHDVDIYNYLLDERPERVYCELDSTVRDDVDETATLTLSYGETTGVINESWHVPVFGKQRDLTVVGTKRSAHIDYLEDTVVELYDAEIVEDGDVLRRREEGKRRHETEPGEPLRVEVEAFVEACEERTEPRAPGRVGAETVELLEAARQSSEESQAVEFADRDQQDSTAYLP